ncbi:MAG: hypothetical protein CML16_10245 [Pusillimonas sp.]|nr:hypothetical protein [Pusillimonas sp.]MBC43184.1 hypothetical protein [Pusillimonas sp.]HCP76916.1 hypothetical protein [Pusillimonas sp.]
MVSIAVLQRATESAVWTLNACAVALVVIIYFASRRSQIRGTWALLGGVLLLIAAGNAVLLENARVSTAGSPAALLGMMVFAPLGSTFIANWLVYPSALRAPSRDRETELELLLARAKIAQSQSDKNGDAKHVNGNHSAD